MPGRPERDEIIARLPMRSLVAELCPDLTGPGSDQRMPCLWHQQRGRALVVNRDTGAYFCHNAACEAHRGGGIIDLYRKARNVDVSTAFRDLAELAGLTNGNGSPTTRLPIEELQTRNAELLASRIEAEADSPGVVREINDELVIAYHENLLADQTRLNWLIEHRGLSVEIIRRFRIGWDGSRYTIPVFDEDERCVNIRRYLREAEHKMTSFREGFGRARLFPLHALLEDTVYLFAGELDTILAHDRGVLGAITTTGGEGNWNADWNPLFGGKHLVVVYDTDAAGRAGAARVIAELRPFVASIKNVVLDLTLPHKDFTDALVLGGQSVADLHALVAATPILPLELEPEQAQAIEPVTATNPFNEADRIVDEFNENHLMVLEGGKAVVMREEFSDELQRNVLIRINRSEFTAFYGNRFVEYLDADGDPVKKPVGRFYLDHPRRRSYERMTFAPNRPTPPGTYNLWRGYAVTPRAGAWPRIETHLRNVICRGVEAWYEFLIRWIAFVLQFPDRRSEVAVVLRGQKGTGKGMLGHFIRRLLGQHGVYISQPGHLTGRFNAHLVDAAYLFVDEGFWAGNKEGESVLKSLITEEVMMIERKGVDVVPVANRLSILIAANANWAVPASREERRYFVLDVSDAHRGDTAYFAELTREMEGDGADAFLHAMLAMNLSGFDHRIAPMTDALAEQVVHSFSLEERWWHERLTAGVPVGIAPMRTPAGSVAGWAQWNDNRIEVAKEDLHADYLEFAQRHRAPSKAARATQTLLGSFLKSVIPSGMDGLRTRERRAVALGAQRPGDTFELPDLAACRSGFNHDRPGLFPPCVEDAEPE